MLGTATMAGPLFGLQARQVPTGTSTPGPTGIPGRWIATLNDEFRGSSLNANLWNTQYPWGPDNNGDGSQNCYLPSNVNLDRRGHLVLTGRRGIVRGTASNGQATSWPFSSGQINTFGKFSLRLGAVEIRAKVPTGPGSWPAFWALPANGSWPPEVDFMEVYGDAPNADQMTFYPQGSVSERRSYSKTTRLLSSAFSDAYHVFGCAMSPSAITWYIDGMPQWSLENRRIIAELPLLYLVCNLAIGGIGGDPSANRWPQHYVLDYVRAWNRFPEV